MEDLIKHSADNISQTNHLMSEFGLACNLLFQTERRSMSIAACRLWLWPPIRLGQYVRTINRDGWWTGYATWAYMSNYGGNLLLNEDPAYLDISQWNDGCDIWIIDVVAPFGNLNEVLQNIKNKLPTGYSRINRVPRSRRR